MSKSKYTAHIKLLLSICFAEAELALAPSGLPANSGGCLFSLVGEIRMQC